MSADPIAAALERARRLLLRTGCRFAVAGGLAVAAWGRPRATEDVDLVIALPPAELESFLGIAVEEGYAFDPEEAAMLSSGGFLRLVPDGPDPLPLDLLVADSELLTLALDRAVPVELGGSSVPFVAPEELILLKLIAFRPKDTFDLETVIDSMGDRLQLDHLRHWADRLGLRARLEAFLAPVDEGESPA